MKILYEVSNLGAGHVDFRSRAGIFRVVQSVVDEIIKIQDIEPYFTSNVSFKMAVQTHQYFDYERNYLNEKFIDYWNFPLGNVYLYNSILKNIHKDKSRSFSSRLRRKLQSIFLDLFSIIVQSKNIEEEFEIYHSFFYPLSYKNGIQAKARVITIYDMLPMKFPEFFLEDVITGFYNSIKSININTDWAICISNSTKRDFCEFSSMPENRVFVTPLAASTKFFKEYDLEHISLVRDKYNIPEGNYILSLSTIEPRKNIKFLIKSFFKLLTENKLKDLYLELVGSRGWLFDDIINTTKLNSNLQEKVIFTGHIPDEELSAVYSGATFFVYPSLYEGFGLPPLEAMQCGIPVITSNTSSLPEVVGDAGIMIDPKDENALCQAMLYLLNDSTLRQQLEEKSLERSQQFSWAKCANDTVEIYKKILS